jgi:uncharacterized membrane protein
MSIEASGALTALFSLACGLIFWSAFCRLVLVDSGTLLHVRLVFMALGVAAAFAVFSVSFWGYRAVLVDTLLAGAFASVLVVSSARWRGGVPSEYESSRGEFDSRPETAESRP